MTHILVYITTQNRVIAEQMPTETDRIKWQKGMTITTKKNKKKGDTNEIDVVFVYDCCR